MLILALLLALCGMACLKAAMSRTRRRQAVLRLGGAALLIGSCAVCVVDYSAAVGLVAWCGALTPAALLAAALKTPISTIRPPR